MLVDVSVTLLLGGLPTLSEDRVIVCLCPESLDEVIENLLLSPLVGDVVSESPSLSQPISVIIRGRENSTPAFTIKDRLSMISSFKVSRLNNHKKVVS